MNHTLICLIPKKEDSRKMKDFRPISLITGPYKIIAKIIANRLREALSGTISESQGAFIKDRQICDMALIANEAVEDLRASGRPGVVYKIDFEKAYDHVRWEFLYEVMEKKGFGQRWVRWIKGCLESVNDSMIINGRPRGSFDGYAGLR